MNEYNKSRHCVHLIRYHIIFVTKYRHPVIRAGVRDTIYATITDVASRMGCRIVEINGEQDHVHFVLESAPSAPGVASVVNSLKSVSSRIARVRHPDLLKQYYGIRSKLWSRSYFAASVGVISLETLTKYIKNQDRGDSSLTCRG